MTDPRRDGGDPIEGPVSNEVIDVWSYDEIHHAAARVYRPRNPLALAGLLRAFSSAEQRHRLSFRGGGQAMDGHAVNADVVVHLEAAGLDRIDEPACDERGWHVTVGAAASWGDVLARTAERGLVPYSVVTTSHATVGGTVASDCLSRCSPISGREGAHVRSFKMITVDGRTLECRKDDPDADRRALFHAVIGGFGYLGVLTEVDVDLRPPLRGWAPGRAIRVATTVDKYVVGRAFGGSWSSFLPWLRERVGREGVPEQGEGVLGRLLDAFHAGHEPPDPVEWDAVSSAAWYALGQIEALLFRSRYVLDDRPLHPMPLYQRASKLLGLLSRGMTDVTLTELAEGAMFAVYPSGVYVDELDDFTFFMENQFTPVKKEAGANGWRLNTIQQTFVLPATPTAADALGVAATHRFLERIRPLVFGDPSLPALLDPMRPTLIDVLYLPADEFLLSACRGEGGYAVTLSFTERNEDGWDTLKERLRTLSRECHELGGRVHLVKNVEADPGLLREMYGGAFAEFLATKRRYDPRGLLENEFFDRIFAGGEGGR
jgi:decaprenylphospho-beta-D-ribofuranose 2-oxidase